MTATNRPADAVRMDLDGDAYCSKHFERVFESFRPRFPEGFRFTISPDGKGGVFVTARACDEDLAREIVDAIEAAAV